MRLVALLLLLFLTPVPQAAGQVQDDFSDGDFTANPSWSGETGLWSVVPFGTDSGVQLSSTAASDTAWLSTPNSVAYGTWRIAVRYEGGRLSNFNQIRVFLTSSGADLSQLVDGYQIQLGTNDRNIRLYRLDIGASGGRVLLASSANDVLGADDATIQLEISRSQANDWTVIADAVTVLTHTESENVVGTSGHFGVWVKHSASRNQHYFFDDVDVSDSLPPDETPPAILSAGYSATNTSGTSNSVRIQFTETLDPSTVIAGSFVVNNGIGVAESIALQDPVSLPPGSLVELTYDSTIPSGDYSVAVSSVADLAGNAAASLTADFSVVSDTDPPVLLGSVGVDSRHVTVTYDEVVAPSSACVASNYQVSGGVGAPMRVLCPNGAAESVELEFDTPIPGGTYTLTISNIADLNGNILSNATSSFSIDVSGDIPSPGDVVINEISYDPAEANLEFVELLNVSDKTFDLSEFEFSDNRVDRVSITPDTRVLSPGQYAVLVRDNALFAAAYPNVQFIAPNSWPALNNSGDASVLFYAATTVDSVAFLPSWGGADVSLERKDPAGPSNSSSNWASSTDPAAGTPGRQNSVFGPDLSAPIAVFAEQLTNSVVRIYFDEPIDPVTAVVTNIAIGGATASSVSLLPGDEAIDATFASIGTDGISIAGIRDVTGNLLSSVTLPIARYPDPGEIRITEILYDPLTDDSDGLQDQVEFVELLNRGSRTLSLTGLYWTDTPNEGGEADTLRLTVRATGISPGGYAVIFAQAKAIAQDQVYSESDLVLAYPLDYRSEGTSLLPYVSSSLGLLNDGDLFRLHRSDDVVLDEVDYDPDWNHPGLRDATGTSLERIDPDGPSGDEKNWSSSVAPEGATPGRQNSIYLTFAKEDGDGRLSVNPSPFSPDYDGSDDFAAIQYDLVAAQSTIRVRVFDSQGRIVRELEPAGIATQTGTVVWDGRDNDGNDLRIGIYVVFLEATDIESGTTEAYKEPVVLARPLN